MSDTYSTTRSQPSPATTMPPGVADAGKTGSMDTEFALADHTHASKARKDRLQTAADGTLTWTYKDINGDPAPFGVGVVPRIVAVAETAEGVTDVINAQIVGTPGNASCKIAVTRTQRSAVALLGLTILSLPSSPGVTWVHLIALEP